MKTITLLLGLIALFHFAMAQNAIINNQFISTFPFEYDTVNVMANNSCPEGNTMKVYAMPASIPGNISFWNDSQICFSINPVATDTVLPVLALIREKYFVDGQPYYAFYNDTTWVTLLGKTWIDVLEVNDISATALADGYLFNNLYKPSMEGFEVPVGSGIHTIYNSSLWLGAFDEEGVVHITAQQYNEKEFYPGPISWQYDSLYKCKFQTIWHLTKSEVEFHKLHWQDENYVPSDRITSWPGNGDPQNGQMKILAPFYDRNHDSIYEPHQGDYPLIRGDEALFFMYNDARVPQGENLGLMLGAEIHGILYAFSDTHNVALNQTIFLQYSIFNRSQNSYNNLFIGSYVDFDLGNGTDDFVGCDTLLNLFYVYNEDACDEDGYWWHPPAQGAQFLNCKMDGFSYSGFGPSATSGPRNALECYYFLTQRWDDGTPMTYGGNGYGGSVPFSYMYPGDPSDPEEWCDSTGFYTLGRDGLGTLGPFNFAPGQRICIDMAFPFARDNNGTNLTSVTLLKQRAASIQAFYDLQNYECPDIVLNTPKIPMKKYIFKAFPNPSEGRITIQSETMMNGKLQVYSSQGILLFSKAISGTQSELNLENLPKGMYLLRLNSLEENQTERLIID